MRTIKPKKGKSYIITENGKNEKIKVKCSGKIIGPLVGYEDEDGKKYSSDEIQIVREV